MLRVSKNKSQSSPGSDDKGNTASKRPLKRKRPRPAFFILVLLVVISAGFYTLFVIRHGDELRDYYLRRLLVSADNAEQEIDRLWNNVYRNRENPGKIDLIPVLKRDEAKDCVADPETESVAAQSNPTEASGDKSRIFSVETQGDWYGGDAILCFFINDSFEGSTQNTWIAQLANLLESQLPIRDFDSVLLTRESGEVLLLLQHQNMVIDIVSLDIRELQKGDEQTSDSGQKRVTGISKDHTSIGEFSFAGTDYLGFVQPMHIPIDLDWHDAADVSAKISKEKTWFLVGMKEASGFRAEAMAISPTALLVIFSVVVLALFALPYLKLRYIGSREALHRHDVLVLTITLMIATSGITFALLELHMRDTLQHNVDDRLNLVADDISGKFQTEVQSLNDQLRQLTLYQERQSSTGVKRPSGNIVNLLSNEIINDESLLSGYPFLEMVYWVNKDGMQTEKWGIKDKTTSLISLKDREYFKNARDFKFTNLLVDPEFKDFMTDPEYRKGWSLESIRSKNTGEVSSVLSQHVGSEHVDSRDDVIVAAAYSPLLSVIGPVLPPRFENGPVLPPGFEFAIIDAQGNVLFHADPSRNLSENLFEWVNQEDRLRAAVWSRNEQLELSVKYRARDYRIHLRPLPTTQWSLVVLYDDLDSRLARVDILTVAFFLYLIYLVALLSMYFYLWWRTRDPQQDLFYVWLWPDRTRGRVYRGFLLIAVINVILWAILFWYGTHNGFHGQTEVVAGSALLGLITFAFPYRLLRLANPKLHQNAKKYNYFTRLRPFGWYVLTLLVSVLIFPDNRLVVGCAVAAVLVVLHVVTIRFSRAEDVPTTPSDRWSALYVTAVCAMVGVTAILPPFMFYGAAHDEIMELSAKREQLDWSASLGKRYERHLEKYKNIIMDPRHEALIRERLRLTGEDKLGEAWDIHGAGGPWTAKEQSTNHSCSATLQEQRDHSPALRFAADYIPGYTAESYELRSLANNTASPTWCWSHSGESKSLDFFQERYRRNFTFGTLPGVGGENQFVGLHLSSPEVRFGLPGFRLLPWIITLLVAILLVVITKNLLRLVYLMDLKLPVFLNGDNWPKGSGRRHRLVLRGRGKDALKHADESSAYPIDVSRLDTDKDVDRLYKSALSATQGTVRLTQFHVGLWDPQVAARKLLLLERLLTSGKQLEVNSDINPMHFFVMRSRDYLRGLAESEPDLGRWSAVLAEFTRCRTTDEAAASQERLFKRLNEEQPNYITEKTTRALKLLASECCASDELEEVAVSIARHPGFKELAHAEDFPEPVINQVLDQAESYYRMLWSISSKDERMVLYHVAEYGFVSWRSCDLVRRLVNRGLIDMVPHPRPMNLSFWRFVQHAEMPEVLEQWTEEAGASVWTRLKGPLSLALVLVIAFLFVTQPQLLKQGMAFTAVLAAGAPALVKLFSMLVQSRMGAGSQG
jgi:hypothetical protein